MDVKGTRVAPLRSMTCVILRASFGVAPYIHYALMTPMLFVRVTTPQKFGN